MSGSSIAVSSSVLASDALAAWAGTEFALRGPLHCRLVSRGVNDVYRITSEAGLHFLRVSPHAWRTPAQLEAEAEFIDELNRRGVHAARAIRTRDGAVVVPLMAPEGTRLAMLFEAARGAPAPELTIPQAKALGRAAARLHLTADGMSWRPARFNIDDFQLLLEPLSSIRNLGLDASEELGYLESIAERVRGCIGTLPQDGAVWGLCHGDLHPGNAVFDLDGTPTLFDFDFCGYGWRVYNLTVFLWNAVGERRSRRWTESRWRAFLRGYREERRLTDHELEAVPLFLVARQIWLMGLDCRGRSGWPVQWVNERWLRDMLRPIRAWQSEHPILRP